MSDAPRHPTPSTGLVPDPDVETDRDRLTADGFDEPMDEENLDNEEVVYPGDTEFEQDMEDDEVDRYGEV